MSIPDTGVVAAITVARVAFWAAVAAVIVALGSQVYRRSGEAASPTARVSLHAHAKLSADDLVSSPIEALNGRYLDRDRQPGDPVTLAMTRAPAPALASANTLAVVLTVPAGTPAHPLGLEVGRPVGITSDKGLLALGRVLELTCGGPQCTVLVGVDKLYDADPAALRNATLAPIPVP